MIEEKRIPEVRFKGFDDDWEQRKLGELGKTYNGLSGKTKEDFGVGDAEFVTYLNIFNNPISNLAMTENVEVDQKQNEVKYGDVFFTTSSETPEEVGMSSVWLDNRVNVYLNSFCFGFRPLQKIDAHYMGFLLRIEPVRKQFILLAQGISRYNISKVKAMDIKVFLPRMEEQQRIGRFFMELDNLITLHQRKLESIKNYKKAMLQKMFPEKGEKYPRLRFAGFTDAWEQRKLDDVAEFSKGSGYTKNDLTESGSPIILYGRLYTKYETVINDVDTFVDMKDKSVISEGNEVVVPSSGETAEDISRASVIGKSGIILGGDLNIIKPKQVIDPIFLALTISYGTQQRKISKRAQGKSIVHLHNSDLKQVNLLYPKLKEQQQIGQFFQNLDNLITLHQRKLENLENLKKALLQRMFI